MPAPRRLHRAINLVLAAALASAPAFAEKPEWAGGGGKGGEKHGKHEDKHRGGKHDDKHRGKHDDRFEDRHGGKHRGRDDDRHGHHARHDDDHGRRGGKQGRGRGSDDVRVGAFFTDQNRHAARTYYTQHYGGGKSCPPGLAKKNNGCMPPGQAKKWAVGQRLPAGVVVYAVPQPVLLGLPPAPVGHKYVRVATDILLIAVGSQMVVDGITDLMRL